MSEQMTTEQATNEALLRFIRKTRRLEPAAFNRVWAMLPGAVQDALRLAEVAADKVRDEHKPTAEGLAGLDWPAGPELEDEE